MSDLRAVIDKINLPFIEEERLDAIYDYFCDHIIHLNETATQYNVTLKRSNYDYCDNIDAALAWLGIKRNDVQNFYISGPHSFLCLLESWIPYGWSLFLAKNSNRSQGISVIHLDDHADMMSPKIGLYGTVWKDMLTHAPVDMRAPETIRQAVLSGAITLGSMMTPLIYYFNQIDVFHLTYGKSRIYGIINRTSIADNFLDPGRQRMAIENLNCPSDNQQGIGRYLRTPDIDEIINSIPPKRDILLHIDMDYFNNRFNGSSEWRSHSPRHDLGLGLQKEEMKKICDRLVGSGLVERIIHVSIGISPSFYPSEFWEDAVTFLLRKMVASGLQVSDILEYIETH